MTPNRRQTLLAAAGAGLATIDPASAAAPAEPATAAAIARQVDALARVSEQANDALMRGDVKRYAELVQFAPDFTLMSPFGGKPSHGVSPQAMAAMERFFRNGRLRQEVVQAYGSADMVVLAVIEHAHVEVGGLPAQDWKLRVTLVYRREGTQWLLAHRHADPLAPGISVAQSAALARGEARAGPAGS